VSFEAGRIAHELAVTGRHRADLARLAADLRSLCECHQRFFGGSPPMDRYLFQLSVRGDGYGGLEHRSSSSLVCGRSDLPRAGEAEMSSAYRALLGLFSHEYFHAWNVKAIRPAAFLPYDLSREVHTRLLWVFEGITSYYDDLALVRAGLIEPESYLDLLGQTVTRVWRGPGRFRQSLAESSFDAWTRFYRQDENSPNAIVSYYAKGAVVALALDAVLRRETGDRQSLDEVMRRLWQRYGLTGRGVEEEAVERLAEEVAGRSLADFFARYVHGTEDPPLAELLAYMGVDFRLRPAEGQADKGGRPAALPEWLDRPSLGIRFETAEGGVRVTHVMEGGAGHLAGIAAGDVLVALDGLRVTAGGLEALLGTYPVGAELRLHAFRRDELIELVGRVQAAPADTCVLSLLVDVDDARRARREAWLRGSWR
jgi:predicted metalloprotease with PDZ domain